MTTAVEDAAPPPPPVLVHPVLGRALAYAGQRAHDRKTTKDAVAHAVWELTLLTGLVLPDAECGRRGYIPLGEWDPGYGHNCPECAAVLAGGELPELPEPPRAPEPAPVLVLVLPEHCTPSWTPRRLPRRVAAVAGQVALFGAA